MDLNDIELGIGTWAWGDTLFWGYGQNYQEDDIAQAFEAILNTPNILLDTAEVYGMGRSESFIGQFDAAHDGEALVATKFFPFPWRWHARTLTDALKDSLHRLNRAQVMLYQIHWPFPPVSIETWVNALADAAESGLTQHIGVSNYDAAQTQRAVDALAPRGIPLVSNQVKYSLLDRKIEKNGLLALCKQLGVRVIAYSPLEQGLLTGKYTPENPPPGARGLQTRQKLEAIQPLIATMRDIGKAYAENGVVKTPAQVAINWCICKGTLPIPGAKNAKQAQQNLGALGWQLKPEEIAILDTLSDEVLDASPS